MVRACHLVVRAVAEVHHRLHRWDGDHCVCGRRIQPDDQTKIPPSASNPEALIDDIRAGRGTG